MLGWVTARLVHASLLIERSRYIPPGAYLNTRSKPPRAHRCVEVQGAHRVHRSTNHGGDLLEGQCEHVMEYERQPLGWGQGIEHDEERKADRVVAGPHLT